MKRNFEGMFRRLLGVFETRVRQDQSERRDEYQEVSAHEVEVRREKVIRVFRHREQLVVKYRDAFKKIQNETMDPPVQEIARKALALK